MGDVGIGREFTKERSETGWREGQGGGSRIYCESSQGAHRNVGTKYLLETPPAQLPQRQERELAICERTGGVDAEIIVLVLREIGYVSDRALVSM